MRKQIAKAEAPPKKKGKGPADAPPPPKITHAQIFVGERFLGWQEAVLQALQVYVWEGCLFYFSGCVRGREQLCMHGRQQSCRLGSIEQIMGDTGCGRGAASCCVGWQESALQAQQVRREGGLVFLSWCVD